MLPHLLCNKLIIMISLYSLTRHTIWLNRIILTCILRVLSLLISTMITGLLLMLEIFLMTLLCGIMFRGFISIVNSLMWIRLIPLRSSTLQECFTLIIDYMLYKIYVSLKTMKIIFCGPEGVCGWGLLRMGLVVINK